MFELVLAIALSSVASAFCSVSEAAFYSFPWSRIEQLRKQGKKSGEILHAMRHDVEKPIAAILTLNTVANTAGASIAGAAWVRVYGPENLGWFALGFTGLILIVAEIIPKTVGVGHNRALMPVLAYPLLWLVRLLSPLVWAVSYFGRVVRPARRDPEATEDDIRALVSLTRRAGVLKPYEELAIRNILSLDNKTVDQIMTPRTVVFSLPAETTVAEARDGHPIWPHSRIPVYEGEDAEDVVGVIFRRQVFEALADDQDNVRLVDLMRPVDFVTENLTLDKLLIKFLASRQHLFVVLDEYGGLAGVVSLEDVLEEILGSEIVDETDQVVDMRELARRRRSELTKSAAQGPRNR